MRNQPQNKTFEFTISVGNIGFLFVLGAVELVTLPGNPCGDPSRDFPGDPRVEPTPYKHI